MTGVLIATKTEAHFLLRQLAPARVDGIFHYRGILDGKNIAVYLTRPGVAAKEQLRRFLRLYGFEQIISTGACGNLTSELTRGDIVRIAAATSPGKQTIVIAVPPVPGARCSVSVGHLVTGDRTKADLRAQTGADIVDMETHTIAAIMREKEFAGIPFTAVRVVDDLPGEEDYLYKEKLLRDMTVLTPSGRPRWGDIWRFGIWDYFRITMRRHRVAREVLDAVRKYLRPAAL